jgi:hypothetical protein
VSLLLCAETESNVSVCCNQAQVFVDPGETSRVFKLATIRSNKRYDANLSVNTILLQVHKWTTAVTLEHKTVEVVKCNYTS